jgi:stage III sporulation protein SpoIIIAA
MSESSGHRSCKCGAVYDRSEHIEEAREISSFECVVCGETIENWNSAWVPRYQFIACPATTPPAQ